MLDFAGAHRLDIRVAHVRIRIAVAGDRLAAALLAPFAHLRCDDDAEADLRVDAWSVAETGVAPAPGQAAETLSPDGRAIQAWFAHADALTRMDMARPFQRVLLRALARLGLFALHAAVVAPEPGAPGLLLAGTNGSGKSTTTVAAVGNGFAMLGDDCVLVPVAGEGAPVAYSLYNSCCLTAASRQLLPPSLRAVRLPAGSAPDAKGVMLLGEDGARVARSARLAAAVFPIVPSAAPAASDIAVDVPHRLSEAQALRRAMPALRFARLLDDQARRDGFATLSPLVAGLPGYGLPLGPDLAGVVRALRTLAQVHR